MLKDPCEALAYLPRWQREIHARCVHPSGTFVEFTNAQVEESIPRLFEQQVLNHPHQPAVRAEGRALTYAELNDKANAIAAAVLKERGEASETIALLLEHDTAAIAAILGVLKAGKICVPLDAGHPKTRLEHILSDSGAALILSSQRNLLLLAREIAGSDRTVLAVDALGPGHSTDNANLSISPDQLAYIIYTSGSTGPPKGVTHSHRNILHTVRNHTNWFHICAEDRVGLLFSLGAIGAARDTFGALLNGATLFPFDIKSHTMTQLAKWLMNEQITTFRVAATVFRHFTAALTEHESFPNLRLIHAGTEMVYKRDVELYRQYFPQSCFFTTGMGATELSPISSILVDHGNGTDQGIVSGGYPVDGVEVKLLGDDGNDVGSDEVGEIVIRSRYLSPGYWRHTELTNAAFATDPDDPDVRVYRTGDLGRLLPDGCLVLLGRRDAQVKIRGHRVELAEVESALLEADGVAETVVAARADGSGEQRLVAYFVPSSQPAPTVSSLRRALSDRVPDYMLPSAFMALDSLPLTPNGKVNRLALPEPGNARPELDRPYEGPRTPVEEELARIWADILDLDRVGIHDNFFDLGGESLLGARLFAQIEKEMGATLPLATLLHSPSVEQLADLIRRNESGSSHTSLVSIRQGGSKPPFFMVHGADGYILDFRNLAPYLGEDQPFYGLEAVGCDGEQELLTSFEAMASHYVREIRSVQPGGPYFLGGFCMGGKLALEMGRQILAQGQEVACLVFMDTGRSDRLSIVDKVIRRAQRWTYLVRRTSLLLRNIMWTPPPQGRILYFRQALEKNRFLRTTAVREVNYSASRRYVPRVYQGRITAILSEQQVVYSRDDRLEWDDIAVEGVDVYRMPGREEEMLKEPNVAILASHLKTCLDEAGKLAGVNRSGHV